MQGDVWICMELLDSSMDKISERVYHQLKSTIPEEILGKMTVSVSFPLSSHATKAKTLVVVTCRNDVYLAHLENE